MMVHGSCSHLREVMERIAVAHILGQECKMFMVGLKGSTPNSVLKPCHPLSL